VGRLVSRLLAVIGPPRDDFAEAGLSGDLDELPEEDKNEELPTEEVGDDD
jgi:hypothetical protein